MKLRWIVPILLGISVSLLLAIGRSGGVPLDYAAEVVSPGFLFVLAMCVWLLSNPKTVLPLQAIVFFLLLPVLGGVCGTALHFADLAFPMKWDHVLYRLDAGLGFAPAWAVGQWARASRGFWQQVYEIWAIAVVVCWLSLRVDSQARARRLLYAYALNLAVGCTLFLILPASGPVYAFPSWPAPVMTPALSLAPVAGFPNSIPSLHVSGAIVLLLYARNRKWRALWTVYVLATAVSTLALGEHYLIDLAVAVPFACFAVAAIERQWLRGALALASVMGWMVSIRYEHAFLVEHAGSVWLALLGTLACCTQRRFSSLRLHARDGEYAVIPERG